MEQMGEGISSRKAEVCDIVEALEYEQGALLYNSHSVLTYAICSV